MELNEALKVVLELAEQNMLNDPGMEFEMLRQLNAIENVRMHMQELQSPSPLQVVLLTDGDVIHEAYSNVPTQLVVLDEWDECLDSATDGRVRLFPSQGDEEFYVDQPEVVCDPMKVAVLVQEATA